MEYLLLDLSIVFQEFKANKIDEKIFALFKILKIFFSSVQSHSHV